MLSDNCYAVVMAGGAGSRLWPLSSKEMPKHFLKLFAGRSLIELTVDKLRGHIPDDRIILMTSVKCQRVARQTLPQIPADNFVFEPCLRDTASAIGLAATVLRKRCETATMIMLTADQIIEPADRFNAAIASATSFLELHPDRLVAFGVRAASPSTLVGWQKLGEPIDFEGCEVRPIVAFTEKPELDVARDYFDDETYCWNSGQFAWKAEAILREIENHVPEAAPLLRQIGEAWNRAEGESVLGQTFPRMPTGSIDHRVMQKTKNACSILLPCHWEDMGTHAALAGRIGAKRDDNAVFGKAIVRGTGNSVLANTDQYVVVAADNIDVVVTDDTVFVGNRDTDMKAVVEEVARLEPGMV